MLKTGGTVNMRTNVLLKAFIVGVVAVAFVVPLAMIWGVVRDRAVIATP